MEASLKWQTLSRHHEEHTFVLNSTIAIRVHLVHNFL